MIEFGQKCEIIEGKECLFFKAGQVVTFIKDGDCIPRAGMFMDDDGLKQFIEYTNVKPL